MKPPVGENAATTVTFRTWFQRSGSFPSAPHCIPESRWVSSAPSTRETQSSQNSFTRGILISFNHKSYTCRFANTSKQIKIGQNTAFVKYRGITILSFNYVPPFKKCKVPMNENCIQKTEYHWSKYRKQILSTHWMVVVQEFIRASFSKFCYVMSTVLMTLCHCNMWILSNSALRWVTDICLFFI